jgi:hypothetical protein
LAGAGFDFMVAFRIASYKAATDFVFFGRDEDDNNIEKPRAPAARKSRAGA